MNFGAKVARVDASTVQGTGGRRGQAKCMTATVPSGGSDTDLLAQKPLERSARRQEIQHRTGSLVEFLGDGVQITLSGGMSMPVSRGTSGSNDLRRRLWRLSQRDLGPNAPANSAARVNAV